jgi:hypothetical protein
MEEEEEEDDVDPYDAARGPFMGGAGTSMAPMVISVGDVTNGPSNWAGRRMLGCKRLHNQLPISTISTSTGSTITGCAAATGEACTTEYAHDHASIMPQALARQA